MTSLQFTGVDLQRSTNAAAHNTVDYDTTDLVARRGRGVKITCTFNRPPQSGDRLTIIAETGPSPSESNNSRAVMVVSGTGSGTAWSAVRGSSSSNSVPITINIPVNAIVGVYRMKLDTFSGGRTVSSNLGRTFVLFNPWATDDEVFLANEAERQEYVLNDVGSYWFGNASGFSTRPWVFGQYDKDILNITCTLLERSSVYAWNANEDISRRRDPLHVGRLMTAMVNYNDRDKGVLVGNWNGTYTGGVSPLVWNGSVDILRKWKASGPVKYGQCWVYAGVLCTVCRCLGIPARMITNFASAHDTNRNLVIDTYYLPDGRKDYSRTNDSIWNFHAWVEMWSARPDIGSRFDGWQIVDATPQERSEGIFCLGPCSQIAVKEGEVDLPHDTMFVYTEVNGDEKHWMSTSRGDRLLQSNTAVVGRFTSTKALGSFDRVDITSDYKYLEGSAKEREIFRKAQDNAGLLQPATFSMAAMAVREVKPQFSATFKNAEAQVGQDLDMQIALKSTADKPITMNIKVTATSVIYNNTPFKEILTETKSVTLAANEEKSILIKIPYKVYRDNMSPDNMIDVVAVCEDDIEGKLVLDKVVILKNLPLEIKITEPAKLHKQTCVDIMFTNLLQEDVTDCVLRVEGSGLLPDAVTIKEKVIKQGQSHTFKVKINPSRGGSRCFIADFAAKNITDIKAFQSIPVAP